MKPNKPSNTALIVAAGLQLVQRAPATARVLPDEAIRRGAGLMRVAYPRMARLLRQWWFGAVCRALERATLTGITLHFALRKRILREHARAAVADGCSQVVVLGAGLDTLCMELLAEHPQLCCIEIDHPATQRVKRGAAWDTGQAVHYIGADLAQQPLSSVLAAGKAFRSDVPTLFVAEGLLMYVPLAPVAALFAQMAASAPGCQVAFTWLEPQADGQPNFRLRSRLVDFWLKLRGEPFVSGMPRAGLGTFLRTAGFALKGVSDSVDLLEPEARAALGRKGLPIAGEYIGFARAAV